MIIGIPKEIKQQENRVSLLPSAAYQLTKRGHTVLVEKNAGVGTGYPDADYIAAGATIIDNARDLFQQAEMIVKVKEPLPPEYQLLRKGQILFTYLHLAASRSLTEALLKSGVTGVAYETIEVGNRLPLLEPMSEIAGRMSVLVGAYFLAKHNGGSGVLLGGVPGVLPGRVVVLGGGTSGINAARMATGLGGGRDHSRSGPRTDAISRHHAAHGPHALFERSAFAGIAAVGGSAHRRGARARGPRRQSSLRAKCCARCGQAAWSSISRSTRAAARRRPARRPTMIPSIVEEGVTHYCVANMPAAYARTATQALTNVTYRYVELLADLGLKEACERQPALTGGINTMDGRLTHRAVAEAHGMEFEPPFQSNTAAAFPS